MAFGKVFSLQALTVDVIELKCVLFVVCNIRLDI